MSDAAIHSALRELSRNELLWRNTAFVGVQYYYAESGVYAIRFRAGRDGMDERICLVRARNPADAAEKAVWAFPPHGDDTPKNLAVLRDALEKIAHYTEDGGRLFGDEAKAIHDVAAAAVAAPVRNCDKYATFDEARKAWFDWTERHRNPDGTCDTMSAWLMALADTDGKSSQTDPMTPKTERNGIMADRQAIESRVSTLIQEQLGVGPEQITPEASFMDDLGADSLDCVELVMAMEEEFGICVPEKDALTLTTVGKATEYLKAKGF